MAEYLKDKAGIYCFINKVNGKFYIGSSVNLKKRVYDYFSKSYYKKSENTIIQKAILKYGLANFELAILETSNNSDTEGLLSREQFFINSMKPEYNILKIAGNSLGYKHTPESIAKIRKDALGRIFSKETIGKMSEAAKSRWSTGQPGISLSILDLLNNNTTEYLSIAQAARELGLNPSSISKRINKGITSAFKGRYVITVKRSEFKKPSAESSQ